MRESMQYQPRKASKAMAVEWSEGLFEKKYEEIRFLAEKAMGNGDYLAYLAAGTADVDFQPVSIKTGKPDDKVHLTGHNRVLREGWEIGFWVPCRDRLGGKTRKLLLIKNPQAKQRKGGKS